MTDRVNVKECKYYCNDKCERYEEFVEANYADYSVKCICEKENDLGTYDICDYQQLKAKEQKLAKIKEVLEPIKCKHPEDCWENKPDWNGEVYGCEPDDMDNIASCPSKVATSVLQIIEGKDNGI